MNKGILLSIIYVIFVFIQVFLVDNFEFKFGLIFIPILYFLWKNDENNLVYLGFLLFLFYDFFNNNFVSYSLLIYLFLNFIINQFSRLWGRGLILIIKFFVILIIFYTSYFSFLSSNFAINLIIIISLDLSRRVVKGGYFRFN